MGRNKRLGGFANRSRGVTTLAAILLSAPVGLADEQAVLKQGAEIYDQNCARCHQIGEGAQNKVGPHLDGLFGRTAGTVDGFRYSGALSDAGEGGLVWDKASIDAYVEKPRDFIKGNRMSFRGLSNAEERAALIAWLETAATAEPDIDPTHRASVSETAAPGFATEILSIPGDLAYGEYLAGECVTCHQVSGQADGIPSIVGIPKDYFVQALVEYKTNVRTNEVMKLRVQNLVNEEIAHLAEYFSSLEPQ